MSVPLLIQPIIYSEQQRSLEVRLLEIASNKTLFTNLVTYQAWILNDMLRILHVFDAKRAEFILKILYEKLQTSCPEQLDNFVEAILPIYLENKNYTVVRLPHDDVDGWLQQLSTEKRESLVTGGIYLLTKSLDLHYRKGCVQEKLTHAENSENLLSILGLFPEQPEEINYVKTLLRIALNNPKKRSWNQTAQFLECA